MRPLKALLILVLLLAAIFYTSFKGDPARVRKLFEQDLGVTLPEKTATLYRWRGSSGVWQYGHEPPPGVAYEAVEVKPDSNSQLLPPLPEGAVQKR